MSSTILANLVEPKEFSAYTAQKTTVKSALVSSGVLFTTNEISAQAANGGAVFEAPHFNPFAWVESNVMSDDNTVRSTPNNILAGSQIGQKDYRSQSWGAMALASAVAGEDIMEAISNITSTFWVQDTQAIALAKLKGIELGNIANNGGDMVVNVATDATGSATAAQSANYGTILDTIQTMGDSMNDLGVIIMHSQVYTNLQKAEQTAFARPSETYPFVTYYGKRVIVDDGVPLVTGTNRKTYTTYLLGQGAFAYGQADFGRGTEVWADPAAGNGAGEEHLYMRKQFVMHPLGFSSTAAVSAGAKSPTIAQYGVAGAFVRKFDRKNVKIAILKTNA